MFRMVRAGIKTRSAEPPVWGSFEEERCLKRQKQRGPPQRGQITAFDQAGHGTRLLPASGLQQTPRGSEPFWQCRRLIQQLRPGYPELPVALRSDRPVLGRKRHRLETLAGMHMGHPIGLRAVVVHRRPVFVMVVLDHQSMLQRLRQRLHLALQLRGRPACHRLAQHGHQQEENWSAFHGAAQYTDGAGLHTCTPRFASPRGQTGSRSPA